MIQARARQCWIKGIGLAGLSLLIGVQAAPAQEVPRGSTLLDELERAVCFNQWDEAIELAGAVIAQPNISASSRQALIDLQDELAYLSSFGVTIPEGSSCDRVQSLTLPVPPLEPSSRTAGWAAALQSFGQPNRRIVQLDTTPNELLNPPIPASLLEGAPDALADATSLNTQDGFSVAAGTVGRGHRTYAFVAQVGDRLSLDIDVTRLAENIGLNGEDSQLYLFDSQGRLLSENDDADGLQSRIDSAIAPATQVYYAVVTSHNNMPILDDEELLVGWTETGEVQFDYVLTLTGVTPSTAILREVPAGFEAVSDEASSDEASAD